MKKAILFAFVFLFLQTLSAADVKMVKKDRYGSGNYKDLVVDGDFAYIASPSGVDVINISQDDNPQLVASTSVKFNAYHIEKYNNFLFVGSPLNVSIVDISDPANPVVIGEVKKGENYSNVDSLLVVEDFLYILDPTKPINQLVIYNIANAQEPTFERAITIRDGVTISHGQLVKDNDFVYLGTLFPDSTAYLFDYSVPSTPSLVAEINIGETGTYGGIHAFAKKGDILYIGAGYYGLLIYDINDLESITLENSLIGVREIEELRVQGNSLFATRIFGGIEEYDISDAINPNKVNETISHEGFNRATKVISPYLYTASDNNGLLIHDIADISQFIARFDQSSEYFDLEVDEQNRAFIAAEYSGALVVDANDNENLTLTSQHIDADRNRVTSIAVDATKGYNKTFFDVAGTTNVYDLLSGPMGFTTAGLTGAENFAMHYADETLFVGSFEGTIAIAETDANDPFTLNKVGEINIPNHQDSGATSTRINQMVKHENILYIATKGRDLYLYDISDKTNAILIENKTFTNREGWGRVNGIAVKDNQLFVLHESQGLFIYDITDPSNLVEISKVQEGFSWFGNYGGSSSLAVSGDNLFVSYDSFSQDGISKVDHLDISDVASPNIVDTLVIDYGQSKIESTLDNLFIASKQSGTLQAVELNKRPALDDASFETDEDMELVSSITAINEVDEKLQFSISSEAANGSVTVSAGGELAYNPNENYFGEDSFTVTVEDFHGQQDTKEYSIVINSVNDAPELLSKELETLEDTQLEIQLEASDVENDTLSYSLVTNASNGSASVTVEGLLSFSPNQDWNGQDQVELQVVDGNGGEVNASVVINVTAVNDLPVIDAAEFSGEEDTEISGDITASDIDSASMSIELETDAINGSITLAADGSFSYQPNADFNGNDSFTAKAIDSDGGEVSQEFVIEVTPVNDAPDANASSHSTQEGSSLNASLSVVNVDNDSLTYEIESNVSNGSLSINSSGGFTYTPATGFTGSDSFTYKVSDPEGLSDTATVSINVTAKPSGGGSTGATLLLLLMLGFIARRKLH